MATEIRIPRIGMAVADATIVEWTVKEGDRVEERQVILVVETEKVRSDVESPAAGFVHIMAKEGDSGPAGSVIGMLADSEEELAAIQKQGAPAEKTAAAEAAPAAKAEAPAAEKAPPAREAPARGEGERIRVSPAARKLAEENSIDVATIAGTGPGGRIVREDVEKAIAAGGAAPAAGAPARGEGERVLISPVARKMAEEHAIDITRVTGSGPGGRIVREDIEKAIAAKEAAPAAAAPAPAAAPGEKRVKRTIPLTGMRGTIAQRMHQSLAIAAQLTVIGEIDMAEIVRLRNNLVAQESVIGTRITYTDILVYAVARILKNHPMINASVDGNEIKQWEDINIGVATALEEGLIVPVVKNADRKTLTEISKEIKALAEKARSGKLSGEEISGGTFTLTNLGAVGSGWTFETAVINQPESAILRVGGITDRAVVRDGQIVARPIMTYSLTYDHRVIDGAVAAMFMSSLVRALENPTLLLA